jgi:hypothetical protein
MSHVRHVAITPAVYAAPVHTVLEQREHGMTLEKPQRSNYQSYLLRVWREGTHPIWHASLQSTTTKRIQHFATIEALFAFLDGEMTTDDRRPMNDDQR